MKFTGTHKKNHHWGLNITKNIQNVQQQTQNRNKDQQQTKTSPKIYRMFNSKHKIETKINNKQKQYKKYTECSTTNIKQK